MGTFPWWLLPLELKIASAVVLLVALDLDVAKKENEIGALHLASCQTCQPLSMKAGTL